MNRTGELVAGAVLIAFGVILPLVFHLLGALGPIFLPMHIPVLIAGFFLGCYIGLLVGIITPLLSSLVTGMPPFLPVLPIMVAELATYGAVSGYLYNTRHWHMLTALLAAMIAGRLAAMLVVYGLAYMLHISISPVAYITGAVVTGLPGIAVQLVAIPLLIKRFQAIFSKSHV